jgi:ribosomal protein L24
VSAPKVGDRVRVIAGQRTAGEGAVTALLENDHVWVSISCPIRTCRNPRHRRPRSLHASEVEVIEP